MTHQSLALNKEKDQGQQISKQINVLVLRYLVDNGYLEAYERLSRETGLTLTKVDAADNIDMQTILNDYCETYREKYGRQAKLIRSKQIEEGGKHSGSPSTFKPGISVARERRAKGEQSRQTTCAAYKDIKTLAKKTQGGGTAGSSAAAVGVGSDGGGATCSKSGNAHMDPTIDGLIGQSYARVASNPDPARIDSNIIEDTDTQAVPLSDTIGGEDRALIRTILQSTHIPKSNVQWDSISGLHQQKRLLREAVVLPQKYPALFQGLTSPWRGVLLYGPPGTGKTMLAKAIACEAQATFFNISSSIISSKFRGESEKLVKALFTLARHHQPSIIFIDEADALLSTRGGGSEHEASRKVKTEFLVQMDGLDGARDDDVFVLAASNMPWDIDEAILRRLEKRIYVPLPDPEARHHLITNLLRNRVDPSVDLRDVTQQMEGYSGCDILQVAKEAAMQPVRRVPLCNEQDLKHAMLVTKACSAYQTSKYEAFGNGEKQDNMNNKDNKTNQNHVINKDSLVQKDNMINKGSEVQSKGVDG